MLFSYFLSFLYFIIPIAIMLFIPYLTLLHISKNEKKREWVKRQFWLQPNFLSASRYPMGFVSILIYFFGEMSGHVWIKYFAIYWFSFWLVTDLLDGVIARKFELISEKGKILDPFSDKLMLFPALFYFAWYDDISMSWLLVFFVIDIIGQSSRYFIKNKSANLFGKAKTPMAAFVLFLVIVNDLDIIQITKLSPDLISVCLYATIVLALCSLIFKVIPTYWYANILSLLNMTCGIIGIYLILFYNKTELAFAACFIGQFLDLFDGRAAMKWGSTPKGAWFDTVGDAVNFGGTGSLLIYYSFQNKTIALILALIYLFATLFRLIRYTVNKSTTTYRTEEEKQNAALSFSGLPAPAGMLFIGSTALLALSTYTKIGLLIVASFLMISKIPFAHFGRLVLPNLSPIQTVVGLLLCFFITALSLLTKNTQWLYSFLLFALLIYFVYGFVFLHKYKKSN